MNCQSTLGSPDSSTSQAREGPNGCSLVSLTLNPKPRLKHFREDPLEQTATDGGSIGPCCLELLHSCV